MNKAKFENLSYEKYVGAEPTNSKEKVYGLFESYRRL